MEKILMVCDNNSCLLALSEDYDFSNVSGSSSFSGPTSWCPGHEYSKNLPGKGSFEKGIHRSPFSSPSSLAFQRGRFKPIKELFSTKNWQIDNNYVSLIIYVCNYWKDFILLWKQISNGARLLCHLTKADADSNLGETLLNPLLTLTFISVYPQGQKVKIEA